ncbi:M23 family metallopeptidase [Ilumatobacter sp.]|uniref:M23 family metallopeptidase n=1 Tax=Ilumatobacter sp. TaxID=1967498 RepID=UPI003AF61641
MVALIIASAAVAVGSVGTAWSAIERAATVDERADRGTASQVADPERPTTTPYSLPVADGARAGWSATHSTYPATDVFSGCGASLVSPVWGTVLEVRRVDSYDPAVDDPATRGGRTVSILGFDGVRYYLAHFDTIVDGLDVGDEVALGQELGTMGDTGRTSACHLHFAISPPCPDTEWSVRRGVIWPYVYLNAWRRGEQLSPAAEVGRWLAANPTACADAMADPFAPDA